MRFYCGAEGPMKRYIPLLVALLIMGTGLVASIYGHGIGSIFVFVGVICLIFGFSHAMEKDS